jgi:diguanylate cyclase (GGDEF)-like protein
MPDLLTGLPTHRELVAEISPTATHALWIDIDGLIWLNDQFGVDVGDRAIVEVVSALRRALDPVGARLFRVAGDEFLALCAGLDRQSALTLAERAIAGVDLLAIPYRRLDRPDSTRLQVNVAVVHLHRDSVQQSVGRHGLGDPIRATAAEAIFREKVHRNVRSGVAVVV